MAAVPAFPKRCVIWFGRPQAQERALLAAAGWQVREIAPGQQAGIGMRSDDLIVGLVDLRGGLSDTLEHIEQLVGEHRHMALMAMTSPRTPRGDPRVERLLAHCIEDFGTPFDSKRMIERLQRLGGDPAPPQGSGLDALIGESPAMLAMRAAIRKFAPVDLPVLITGETGTGKEMAAHALHELSPRQGRPFTAINCGAIPSTLVQSELFGHERGAFTGATTRRLGLFETANGGTVFLDEIGDLPLDVQTNLLRVLQEGTIERVGNSQPVQVDVRVLAATHVDLEQAVEQGRFRRDLYYRLNVLRLPMPALRERGNDIELLARHFLTAFRERHRTRARGFCREARLAMERFPWPGNVRELLNRVQRAAIIAEGELITCADLELEDDEGRKGVLDIARIQAERDALLACLQQSQYNVSACARRMQVSRVTVYRLCRKHRLELQELR
ncbi:sigma-54 dependent transcriptional regulator [Xanthomonas sp. H13-6]|uniref:Sigma-54 dependent transcriptional regulator n=1 Tax=Xanthomonas chitinilytica TaxID=2989819 RepID=A0ABT3JRS2_9XANT|nr:sigma-54 dependent transcriptional regulator [Xanthomonas sp. H13-6]MCW4471187.1 sigma-54 dependent transcriptional regulator [Xanthomonas sp. H13-6]